MLLFSWEGWIQLWSRTDWCRIVLGCYNWCWILSIFICRSWDRAAAIMHSMAIVNCAISYTPCWWRHASCQVFQIFTIGMRTWTWKGDKFPCCTYGGILGPLWVWEVSFILKGEWNAKLSWSLQRIYRSSRLLVSRERQHPFRCVERSVQYLPWTDVRRWR